MPAGGAIVAGAAGLAKTITGFINKGKAKKEARALEAARPLLKNSDFLNDQLSLAKSELSNGLSSDAERIYQQGEDRSLSASLNAILKGGGDVNNVADVFDASSQGRARLALMNDNLRLSQINNLVKAQDANEQFRQQQFGLNEYKPWVDKVAANAAARKGAEDQIWSGISGIGSAAISAFAPQYPTGAVKTGSNSGATVLNNAVRTSGAGGGAAGGGADMFSMDGFYNSPFPAATAGDFSYTFNNIPQ